MKQESCKRSFIKSITWRIISTLTTILLILLITGNLWLALSIEILDALIKIVMYYFHERI